MFALTFADKRLYLRKADDSRKETVDYPHRGNSSKVHNTEVTSVTDFKNPALFHHFFSGPKEEVIRFLQKENLLLSKFACPKCNTKCKIFFKSRLIDKHNIQCENKHTFPIRKFSFFSLFRLPLVEVWEFIINYLDKMKLYVNADRCGINYNNTAVIWAEIVRDIMCHKIWKLYFKNEFKLSGYVEADETDMGRKIKNHRGKAVGRKVSVFGMVERKSGRSMVFPIEDKSSVTLVTIVNQFVNKDGVMVTDGLISYNSLDHLHFNLIHKTEFVTIYVDMATGLFFKISTNRVEANWRVLKSMFIEMNGSSSDKFESYLAEYMYRNDCKVRNVSLLEELCKDITDIFPLDGMCRLEFPTPFFPTWQGCGRRVIQADCISREELEPPAKIKPRGMLRRKAAYMDCMNNDKVVDETVLAEDTMDVHDDQEEHIIETVQGTHQVDIMENVQTSQVLESFKKVNNESEGKTGPDTSSKEHKEKKSRYKVIDDEAIASLKDMLSHKTHKYLDGLPSSGKVDDLVRSASDGKYRSASELCDMDAFVTHKGTATLGAASSKSLYGERPNPKKGPSHKIKSSKKLNEEATDNAGSILAAGIQTPPVSSTQRTQANDPQDSGDDFESTFNYTTPKRFKDKKKEAERKKKLARIEKKRREKQMNKDLNKKSCSQSLNIVDHPKPEGPSSSFKGKLERKEEENGGKNESVRRRDIKGRKQTGSKKKKEKHSGPVDELHGKGFESYKLSGSVRKPSPVDFTNLSSNVSSQPPQLQTQTGPSPCPMPNTSKNEEEAYRRRNRLRLKKLTHKGLEAGLDVHGGKTNDDNMSTLDTFTKQTGKKMDSAKLLKSDHSVNKLFVRKETGTKICSDDDKNLHVSGNPHLNESTAVDDCNPGGTKLNTNLTESEMSNINAERKQKLIQTKIVSRRSRLRFSATKKVCKTADLVQKRKSLKSCDSNMSCDRNTSCDRKIGVQFKNIGGIRIPFYKERKKDDGNLTHSNNTCILDIDEFGCQSSLAIDEETDKESTTNSTCGHSQNLLRTDLSTRHSTQPRDQGTATANEAINIQKSAENSQEHIKMDQNKASLVDDQAAEDMNSDLEIVSFERNELEEEEEVVEESESDQNIGSGDEEEMDIAENQESEHSVEPDEAKNTINRDAKTLVIKIEPECTDYENGGGGRVSQKCASSVPSSRTPLKNEFPNLMEALAKPQVFKDTVVAIPQTDLKAFFERQTSKKERPEHQQHSIGTFKIHSVDGTEVVRKGLVNESDMLQEKDGPKDTKKHDIEIPVTHEGNSPDMSLPAISDVSKIEPIDVPTLCGDLSSERAENRDKESNAPGAESSSNKSPISEPSAAEPSPSTSDGKTCSNISYNISRGLSVATKLNLKFNRKEETNSSPDSDYVDELEDPTSCVHEKEISPNQRRLEQLSEALKEILDEYDEIESGKVDERKLDEDCEMYETRNSSKRGKKPKRLQETYNCPPGYMSMQRIADYFCGEEDRNKKLDLILSDLALLKRSRPELDVIREQEEVISTLRDKNAALEEEVLKLKGIRKNRIKDEATRKAENRKRLVNAFRIAKDSGSFPTPGPLTLAGQRQMTTTVTTAAAGSSRTAAMTDSGLTPAGLRPVIHSSTLKSSLSEQKKGRNKNGKVMSADDDCVTDPDSSTSAQSSAMSSSNTSVTNSLTIRSSSRIAERRNRRSLTSDASCCSNSASTVDVATAKRTPIKSTDVKITPKKRGRKRKEESEDVKVSEKAEELKGIKENPSVSDLSSKGKIKPPRKRTTRRNMKKTKVADVPAADSADEGKGKNTSDVKETHIDLTGEPDSADSPDAAAKTNEEKAREVSHSDFVPDSKSKEISAEKKVVPIPTTSEPVLPTADNPVPKLDEDSAGGSERSAERSKEISANPSILDESKSTGDPTHAAIYQPAQPAHMNPQYTYVSNQQPQQIQCDPAAFNMMMHMFGSRYPGMFNFQIPQNYPVFGHQGPQSVALPNVPMTSNSTNPGIMGPSHLIPSPAPVAASTTATHPSTRPLLSHSDNTLGGSHSSCVVPPPRPMSQPPNPMTPPRAQPPIPPAFISFIQGMMSHRPGNPHEMMPHPVGPPFGHRPQTAPVGPPLALRPQPPITSPVPPVGPPLALRPQPPITSSVPTVGPPVPGTLTHSNIDECDRIMRD